MDTTQAPSALIQFAPLVVVFAIFYFLMIVPQKKKLQEEQNMLKALKKGDEVFTKSGVLGVVEGLNEHFVTLEIAAGVKVKYMRSQIGGMSAQLFKTDKK